MKKDEGIHWSTREPCYCFFPIENRNSSTSRLVGTCSYGLFDTSVTCEAESRWSSSMVTTAVMETKVHAKEKKKVNRYTRETLGVY